MFSSGARLVNVGLAVLAGALALGFAYVTEWGERLINPVVLPGEAAAKTPLQGVDVLPDFKLSGESAAYNGFHLRPLLNPTRAPAPTVAVVATTEPPKPQIRRGLYELLGISQIGAMRVAQIRETATRRVMSVRQGDFLQELKVDQISNDRVVLVFQGEKDEIQLARFTASSRVPPPPVMPVSPVPVAAAPASEPSGVSRFPAVAAQVAGQVPVPSASQPPGPQTASQNAPPPAPDAAEIQRREAAAAQNPNNWNRARLDSARRRMQDQGGAPN